MIKYSRILWSNNNQFYVIGGSSGDWLEQAWDNCYVVEEETGLMHNIPSMITPRANPAVVFNEDYSKIFVVGGDLDKYNTLNSCELYEIDTNIWIQIPKLNIARSNSSLIWFNNLLYCFGGYNKDLKNDWCLNTIERISLIDGFDSRNWNLMNITLPQPRSNWWVIKESKDSILILGGWFKIFQKSIFRMSNWSNNFDIPYIYELNDLELEKPDIFTANTIAIDQEVNVLSISGFSYLHRLNLSTLKISSISYS